MKTRKILYVSRLCSPAVMDYIFRTAVAKPALSAQKFHQLLAEGLAMQPDTAVATLSALPITPANHRRRWWRLAPEKVGGLVYQYVPALNVPYLKNIIVFVGGFWQALWWAFAGGRAGKYIICDVLNVAISAAALLAGKAAGVKTVAVVTDLPHLMVGGMRSHSVWRRFYNALIMALTSRYDGYILLTEQMNNVVNIRHRPYIVMEGLVDIHMRQQENRLEDKPAERIVMYTGGVFEEYGVKMLIEAFMRLPDADLRLHIYGSGPMAGQMAEYSAKDSRIVYFGMVENAVVVRQQMRATLLVNPRPSSLELAKYSFPSKNMEYMASGTPMLTTRLPGMPAEYYPYVFLFDQETVDGFEHALRAVLSQSRQQLHAFGLKAKEFVMTQKNNRIQGERIARFLKNI